MYKRIALTTLLLLAVVVSPVFAYTWFSPDPDEMTAFSYYGGITNHPNKTVDNNFTSGWTGGGYGENMRLIWVNPENKTISAARIYSSTVAGTSPGKFFCGLESNFGVTRWNISLSTTLTQSAWTEVPFTLTNCTEMIMFAPNEGVGWPRVEEVQFSEGVPTPEGPPIADYVCNFPSYYPIQPNPFGLVCTNTSTGNPDVDTVEWTLTNPDDSTYTTTNASLVRTLTQDGWYGLELEACNTLGCGYKNTTQLINITSGPIPATGINFWATTYDPIKGARIQPSTISLKNLTSGYWRNVSSSGGTWHITATDASLTETITAGQALYICGAATAYNEACYNITVPYSGWEYKINLASTSALPTGTNATLFVNAVSSKDATAIASATITVANTSIPYSKSVLSSAVGIATFVNIPAGTYTITATKTGYQSSTTSWAAPAGLVTNAYIGLQPIGATPVPTDTYGNPIYDTPVPTQTYAPGETQDTRTDEEKDADMMNILRDQGPMLIKFFIVCFVIYMIMGIGKGR